MNPVITSGRLEDLSSDEPASHRVSMPFTTAVKRRSTVSASFRRLKITIIVKEIQGLPQSNELLQLRVQDRSREAKSEGNFIIDTAPGTSTVDLSGKSDL